MSRRISTKITIKNNKNLKKDRLTLDISPRLCYYSSVTNTVGNTEGYRSGHNEAVLKFQIAAR